MKGEEVIYVFLSPHDTPLENPLKKLCGVDWWLLEHGVKGERRKFEVLIRNFMIFLNSMKFDL